MDSDDDAPEPTNVPLPSHLTTKQEHIHYGSIEEKEAARLAAGKEKVKQEADGVSFDAVPVAGRGAATTTTTTTTTATTTPTTTADTPMGGMNQAEAGAPTETIEMGEESRAAQERHEQLLAQVERLSRQRKLAVPTNDHEVKMRLRALKQPICLFGELAHDRRDRLREVLANLEQEGFDTTLTLAQFAERSDERPEDIGLVYSEGSDALKQARVFIANYSLTRAHERLERERKAAAEFDVFRDEAEQEGAIKNIQAFAQESSSIGDSRAVSGCAFSPDSTHIVTTGWSCLVRVWKVEDCSELGVYRGHNERAISVCWSPDALSGGEESVDFVTCGADNVCKLWNVSRDTPVGELAGHVNRVNRVEFHPSGRFVGSTSFDTTWRLWDVNTQTELLLQDGHSRPVYAIAFQGDGSLVATGGLDSIGRVWDMRTGKSILVLDGHIKSVLSMGFAPNGYTLATGSEDHTIKVWDLRKKQSVYTIPAHSNLVSTVKFEPNAGRFLMSASYDRTIKMWNAKDWTIAKTLAGHESRVMGADLSNDGKYVASGAFDKTWKLWAKDELAMEF